MLKLGIQYQRLGPYHHARLRAASKHFDLTAIEIFAVDRVYGWDSVGESSVFRHLTIFPDQCPAAVSADEIQHRVAYTLDRLDPDIVAIPGWSEREDLAALLWCRLNDVPAILMSDSTELDWPRSSWKESIKSRIVRQFAAGLVAGQRHVKYVESLGMTRQRIMTGCDVVDNEYFASGADHSRHNAGELRAQFGLPEHYWLVSCRFIQEKNLERLLSAYARYIALPDSRQWPLVLLGDGPLRRALHEQSQELGIERYLHMPGFRQYAELPVYYGLADALILPSVSETWGLVVNEAMAAGLPVLVSDRCGCTPDLVTNGRNGFTFGPTDEVALASLLRRLESDDNARAVMGRASRDIISGWSTDRFAENLLKVAYLANSAPSREIGWFDHALLWLLIRR